MLKCWSRFAGGGGGSGGDAGVVGAARRYAHHVAAWVLGGDHDAPEADADGRLQSAAAPSAIPRREWRKLPREQRKALERAEKAEMDRLMGIAAFPGRPVERLTME